MSQDLQFDRAEYDQPPASATCAQCKRALLHSYFQVNGQVVCEACAHTVEAALDGGSSIGRLLRAAGAGFGAAVVGAALYYAVTALTGYEFGLIAVVVGFAVGASVRWGSGGRGGWVYQTIAIVLTYLAIVSTYVPPIIQGFREAQREKAAASAPAGEPQDAAVRPSFAQFALAVGVLLLIACVAPFLAGLQNIIGLVIIGIGLYEAWKLNRRVPLSITGPHAVTSMAAGAGA
jgi:hypothetical protein